MYKNTACHLFQRNIQRRKNQELLNDNISKPNTIRVCDGSFEYPRKETSLARCDRILKKTKLNASFEDKLNSKEMHGSLEYNNGHQIYNKRLHRGNESAHSFEIETMYGSNKEKLPTFTNILANQDHSFMINIPSLSNATVSGKKLDISTNNNEKFLNLTKELKKQIILAVLKECKAPLNLLPFQENSLRNTTGDKMNLNKLCDVILDSYDVLVQVTDEKNEGILSKTKTKDEKLLNKSKDLLLIKTMLRSNLKRNKVETRVNEKADSSSFVAPIPKKILKEDNKSIPIKKEATRKLLAIRKEYTINETIGMINKYTALTFKNKSKRYDMKTINALHQKLALGKRFQYEEEFKSRDRISQVKEKLLRILYITLNKSNNYSNDTNAAPRFFVARGNNSPLVKSLMKERWWWIPIDGFNKAYNFLWTQWRTISFISSLGTVTQPIQSTLPRLSNHLEGNYYLGHKKHMHKCLVLYYTLIRRNIEEVVPLTFHIKYGKSDLNYIKFQEMYKEYRKKNKNVWIIKPGENSNRGNGIVIANTLNDIDKCVSDTTHTYIIQKYIERPLLFDNRKFDIRCFCLVTSINGYIKAYYYQDGYLRTSSKDYSVDDMSKSVHLTNEAIQIKYDDFGKHEAGNKISYEEFQQYLEIYCKGKNIKPPISLRKHILPKIKVSCM